MTVEADRSSSWRLLALGVLERALQDAVNPTVCKSNKIRQEARQDALDFFQNQERAEDVRFWCEAAGLNYKTFTRTAAEIIEKGLDLTQLKDAERRRQLIDSHDEQVH